MSSRRIVIILLLLLLGLLWLLMARCSRAPGLPVASTVGSLSPSGAVPVDARTSAAAPVEEVITVATVRVPARVEAGATFRAEWTGPNNPGDYLTIVRPETPPAGYESYQETRLGASLELVAPMEPGVREVRYVAARSKTILGRTSITIDPVSATLLAPDEVVLGAPVSIVWTGPNNAGDYLCIVAKDAPDDRVGNYADAAKGSPLTVTAPVESGEAEIRYVSGQGRKVLGRRKLTVSAPAITLTAPVEVTAGGKFSVTWQGPKNAGDYITIVAKGTPDGQYRNYTDVSQGSPLELVAPIENGEAEIRYMTGTHARVLARRPIKVVAAKVTLDAPVEAMAGALVSITWSGPKNANDYLTIVPTTTPDGQYGNYTDVSKGSPLKVTAPIRPGAAEVRYMSGQGARVLARRAIVIMPASVTLNAPRRAAAGSVVPVEWSGPNNPGDYVTIVPKSAQDGVALRVAQTSGGSPAKVDVPKATGACEVRYMSGQGNQVLARVDIEIQ